jgi:hypothetical protein
VFFDEISYWKIVGVDNCRAPTFDGVPPLDQTTYVVVKRPLAPAAGMVMPDRNSQVNLPEPTAVASSESEPQFPCADQLDSNYQRWKLKT